MTITGAVLEIAKKSNQPIAAKSLAFLGLRDAIDQALSRLVKRGDLYRVGRGLYMHQKTREASPIEIRIALGLFKIPSQPQRFLERVAVIFPKILELVKSLAEFAKAGNGTEIKKTMDGLETADKRQLQDSLLLLPDYLIRQIRIWLPGVT
jgi:hypothetical protein